MRSLSQFVILYFIAFTSCVLKLLGIKNNCLTLPIIYKIKWNTILSARTKMSDSNTESKALTSPIDNVGYDSDSKFDESQELLPNEKRSNNVIEGNLLRLVYL